MKKIISLILVFTIILSTLTGIEVSATTSDEIIDVDIYKAKCLAGIAYDGEYSQGCNELYEMYISDSLFSPTQNFLEDIRSDKQLMAGLNTWEAVSLATKPSSALDLVAKKENYYEACIVAMYSKSTINNSGFQSFFKNKVLKTSNKLVSDFCKLQQIENAAEIIEYVDINNQKTIDTIQTIVKNTYSLKTVENISSSLSEIINYGTDILDVINKISLYGEMVNLDEATKLWLKQMYENCGGNLSLKTAIYNLSLAGTDFSGTCKAYMRTGAVTLSNWTLSLFIDSATKKIASLNPVVAAVFTGLSFGKTISNILFNSDDVYEQIFVMDCIQDLKDLSKTVTEKNKNSFISNRTKESATAFLYSFDCFFELISNVDIDCMKQLYTKLYNKSLVGEWFHNQNYEESIASLEKFRNVRKKAYNTIIDLFEVSLSINYHNTYSFYYGTTPPQIEYSEQINLATNKYTIFANWTLANPATAYSSTGKKLSVTYRSSNTNIATVDSTGKITPVSHGTVTITASTPNGTSDKCTITILPFYATKTNNEYTITDYIGNGGNVTIPSYVNSCPVVAIADYAFLNCTNLTSVTIPDSITNLGKYAFYKCSSLNIITISSNITTIKEGTFCDCTSLASCSIPNSITSIEMGAFQNCDSLKSISLPNNITSIGEFAFSLCDNLTSITIPNSVTSIGKGVFWDSTALNNIKLSNNITTIKESTFDGCISLVSITIPKNVKSLEEAAFYGCSKLSSISFENNSTLNTIGKGAFYQCYSLTKINIPNNVTSIGESSFGQCSSLSNITIPDNVTSIGYAAFNGCTSLANISLPFVGNKLNGTENTHFAYLFGAETNDYNNYKYVPSSLKSVIITGGDTIADKAFFYCANITSITIPDSVTSIGDAAFSDCTSLTNITIPDSVTSIGDAAFSDCTSLTNITIPDSVTSIGDMAFYYCDNLTNAIIGNSVTSIGDYTFEECRRLKSITIGNSITSIGEWAFWGCGSLKEVHITDIAAWCNIRFVDEYSNPLYWSKNLYLNGNLVENLVIPDGVTTIGDFAFLACRSLTSITIPDSVMSIEEDAFLGCGSLKEVHITDIAAWCNIRFADEYSNPLYFAKNLYLNGNLVENLVMPNSVTEIKNYAFHKCSSLKNIIIPDNVTSISYKAFMGCNGLKSITIGNSVTSIGESAFWDCTNLTSVNLGDSVTSIGTDTFLGCTSLKSVNLGDSVTDISSWNFRDCTNLLNITVSEKNNYYSSTNGVLFNKNKTTLVCYPAGKTSTSYCIPDSITSIDQAAFRNCTNLTSITIPDSVINIDILAFSDCDNLTHVYYLGTKTDWENMSINSYNDSLTNANIHFYSPGDVDFDGNMNLNDLVDMAQYLAGWDVNMIYPEALDLNGDGVTNLEDLTHFARYAAGWDVTLNQIQ